MSGGFGRQLSADEIRHYRDDWCHRVVARRDAADKMAAQAMSRSGETGPPEGPHPFITPPLSFIESLPELKQAASDRCFGRPLRSDEERAATTREYIDLLQSLLVSLGSYLPSGQFGEVPLREFFAQFTSSIFLWHRGILEPYGLESGDPVVQMAATDAVIRQLDGMLSELVEALVANERQFDFQAWSRRWEDPEAGA